MKDLFLRAWKAKGLWLRVLFCWALGCTFVFFDETKDYDFRFRLRGRQEASNQIVVVTMEQDEWAAWHGTGRNLLRSLKEYSVVTDSFFWNARTWDSLLGKILAQNPKNVGVTLFFNDQLPKPDLDLLRSLSDARVFWAGQLDNEGRPALPVTANTYGYNVALVDLREDEDRVLRRFTSPLAPLPHLSLKLADNEPAGSSEFNALMGETRLINFRGVRDVYPSVSAFAVLRGSVPPSFFRDKIVLIGTHSVPSHLFQTPLGRMTRTDVLAQVVDNVITKRWINRLPAWLCAIYLLAVLLIAVAIMSTYPQAVAFAFLFWLGMGTTALSIWIFDSFYFWVPALSPLLMGLVTYIIFMGYQLSVKENQTWRLEQETKLLSELDQLRNNFVSLISHDLKTPIAKIQAICDRLLATGIGYELRDGLLAVRKESVELHRYIQSILQVSKLESSQIEMRREATDLNELVERAVSQVRPLSDDKRQEILAKLEPMFSIEVDSVMLQEVILNLIENAVKYTPNDGHIHVETQEVEDKVIFSVKDDGPGIPPEDREHIFEKFFRGQQGTGQIKGTGLGLFLVKYFIELHGGEVFLESEINKGTRVGFTLPLQT